MKLNTTLKLSTPSSKTDARFIFYLCQVHLPNKLDLIPYPLKSRKSVRRAMRKFVMRFPAAAVLTQDLHHYIIMKERKHNISKTHGHKSSKTTKINKLHSDITVKLSTPNCSKHAAVNSTFRTLYTCTL
jgi:hypothetical protein